MIATMLVQGGQRCTIFVASIVDCLLDRGFNFNEATIKELEPGMSDQLQKVKFDTEK